MININGLLARALGTVGVVTRGPLDGVRVAVMVAEPRETHLGRWVVDELKLLGAYAEVTEVFPQRGYTLRLGLAGCGLDNNIEHKLTWRFLNPQRELVDKDELIEVAHKLADGKAHRRLAQKMAAVVNSLSPEPEPSYAEPRLSEAVI